MNNTLSVKDLSLFTHCKDIKVGNVPSTCDRFTNSFIEGVYLLKGDIDDGGWAVSYALSVNDQDTRINSEAQFLYNGNEISIEKLRKHTCYVGGILEILNKEKTIRKEVEKGLKQTNSKVTANEIRDLFHIDSYRFENKIKYSGIDLWKAKAAIGYAYGKTIYCFPWISKKSLIPEIEFINLICRVLKANHFTVLIPSNQIEMLKDTVDFIVETDIY